MEAYRLKWSILLMMITMMVHTFVVMRGTIWIDRCVTRWDGKIHRNGDQMTDFPKLRCTRLREMIISRTSSKINMRSFTEDVQEIMSCPHELNITQTERHRVELRSCCNATGALFLTRQNTHQGQKIMYETNRKKSVLVDKQIFKMLPKSTPWRNDSRFQHCAVVGNSGILKNSSCGEEIDSADIVLRLNLAPVNNSRDVGVKTSLITINPSQIRVGYPDLKNHPQPLVERVSAYGDAPLLMPAFAYTFCTDLSFKVHKIIQKLRPNQKVVFFNPDYLQDLFKYWKHRGLEELRLTTGFMLASVAMELCDNVHLYGFWPFQQDLFQRPLSHHYYDNIGPSRMMHAMPKEFLQLLKMHCQGSIHLHLTQCK